MHRVDVPPSPASVVPPTLAGPVSKHRTRRFSTVGLASGTLFFAVSLTPSLLPRSVLFQGLVSGLSLTLGYAIGRLGGWLWSYLGLPAPDARLRRGVTRAMTVV